MKSQLMQVWKFVLACLVAYACLWLMGYGYGRLIDEPVLYHYTMPLVIGAVFSILLATYSGWLDDHPGAGSGVLFTLAVLFLPIGFHWIQQLLPNTTVGIAAEYLKLRVSLALCLTLAFLCFDKLHDLGMQRWWRENRPPHEPDAA